VFDNRVLGKMMGPRGCEETGDWRRRYNEEILHISGDRIKKNEMGEACGVHGDKRGTYNVMVRKPEGKRTLGRPRLKWEYNIKMGLK
jgi:hypothetical protein